MIYTVSRSVDIYHTDWQQLLTASNIGRYMQECAYDALYAYGPNPDQLRERGYAFILSRISYRTYLPITAKQKIEVSTWPVEGKGLATGRFYSIRLGDRQNGLSDGLVAAEASSSWALINLEEKKPYRTSDVGVNFDSTDYDRKINLPVRFRLPQSMEHIAAHTVNYTDVDLNKHMNNVAYISLLENCLPSSGAMPLEGYYISQLDINYVTEALYGTKLDIYMGQDDSTLYFKGEKQDGALCFDARLVLSRIPEDR